LINEREASVFADRNVLEVQLMRMNQFQAYLQSWRLAFIKSMC